MTHDGRGDLNPITPVQAVARRVKEVRRERGWSGQELAERCDALGMPSLDRSTIANIENGRRQRIGIDEWLTLAMALGVAPVHLLVPITEEWYAVTPDNITGTSRARQWIRGNYPMVGIGLQSVSRQADRETYLSQQPQDEWIPPPEPTAEEAEATRRERIRKLLEAEEAGLVKIVRREDGLMEITPTRWAGEALEDSDGDDDGER